MARANNDAKDEGQSRLPLVIALVAGVALIMSGVFYVRSLLNSEAKPAEQVVQVQVFRPPPPPPPPMEEEPPPPEMEEEELEIPEPEALPDLPDLPDMPAQEQLGLDAEGVAGSDAFGLAANRGGRTLIGGAGAYRWYAQKAKDAVFSHLGSDDVLRSADYRARILVWVSRDGSILRFRIARPTGDVRLDSQLESVLAALKRLPEAPPPGLPQPIAIRIVGHA